MAKEDYKLKSLLTSQAVKSNPKMTTFVVEEDKTPEIYNSILADEYILPTAYLIILKATDETYSARLGDGVNVWSDSAPLSGLVGTVKPNDVGITDAEGMIPIYRQDGQLPVGMPEFPENAVPLLLLDIRVPSAPTTGTYVLTSTDGVVSWVVKT